MVDAPWWMKIMGIGASTNVKEIRIDQKDAKWESYPSSSTTNRSTGRKRALSSLGLRWINSADSGGNTKRLQQLNCALESAQRRAQDDEQRVRQLERELATLELRNMELAEETTWLRKQLSDRPEVPICERPPTGAQRTMGGANVSTSTETSDAYRIKQNQYTAKLESQIRLYEEDILKLKTKMNKETQRLQAELDDQKYRSDKEVRSLDNRLIEAHKLNQKYEELISTKISPDTIAQLRKEVQEDYNSSCANTILAASCSHSIANTGLDSSLSQSKSRAQLILELTEQISMQQDKIRILEEEMAQRDVELVKMRTILGRKGESRVGSDTNDISTGQKQEKLQMNRKYSSGGAKVEERPVVANEDEIEALLNNPAILHDSEEEEEKTEEKSKENLNISQKSLSWRTTSAGLPPSGLTPKRVINIGSTIDSGTRPKTMATPRQRFGSTPKRQNTTEEGNEEKSEKGPVPKPTRQCSVDSLTIRTHSAPMFAFKPRPTSKQSQRSILASAVCGGELPPPIDLEDPEEMVGEEKAETEPMKSEEGKTSEGTLKKRRNAGRKNSESIEVLSIQGQEEYRAASGVMTSASGYDSAAALYDDEGDVEDEDEDDQTCPDEGDSDQEIRRRFEERWRKSTTATSSDDTAEKGEHSRARPRLPRPPAGGAVGQAAPVSAPIAANIDKSWRERVSSSAKSHDSGFLGDSCASTNSLSLWKGRTKRQARTQQAAYDPLDVDKLLEM